ncbi:MAG: sulfatase-like hydrolase/transferase [Phycisphaerae bacterium]|nr:sulfatase-like hydrolase/transferase [Phycisphaerae bacterium]
MKRRDFVKLAGIAGAAGLTGGVSASVKGSLSRAAKAGNPNLLVIQTDEHNFRTLGCYRKLLPAGQAFMWGPSVVETPNIDRLAEDGAICMSFYASTPVCSPSRSSFVSGRYPQNTPVVTNNIPMDDDVVTFAEILRKNGYATGYAGKWHLDGTAKPGWTPKRNFGFEDNRYMFNRGHWKLLDIDSSGPMVGKQKGKRSYAAIGDEKTFTTDWLCDRTIEFIDAHKNESFCYMVSIPDPHGPDTVRAPYNTMFDGQKYTQPRSGKKSEKGLPSWGQKKNVKFNQSKYYGMVKCIDDNIGKIVKHLEKSGLLDDTIVVFTADHGDLRGEHGRHDKGVPYEGSARIPFIMRWPAKIKASTVVRQSLGCVDFMPTILGLMKVQGSGKEEGRDASKLFTGGETLEKWDDITFFRGTGEQDTSWIAAVSSRYKLVYSVKDEPWFFDLEKDPDELINNFRNRDYREVIGKMSRALLEYGKKYNDGRVSNEKVAADISKAINEKEK